MRTRRSGKSIFTLGMGLRSMEETRGSNGASLLDAKISRRGALAATAWSAPAVAMVVAAPMAAASPPFNPLSDLRVLGLGGAEGRYSTSGNFTSGVVDPNNDFRRAFSIQNIGQGGFTGSLEIKFRFPRVWNNFGSGDGDAFQSFGTQDLGGRADASIGGASAWTTTEAPGFTENTGTNAYPNVWMRMDEATTTLQNVNLPAGGVIWFALNATVPNSWISGPSGNGAYFPNGYRIYWRTDIFIKATTSGGQNLGTYGPVPDPDTSSNWSNGIWYWNGGGPFAYDGGEGLYPAFGNG